MRWIYVENVNEIKMKKILRLLNFFVLGNNFTLNFNSIFLENSYTYQFSENYFNFVDFLCAIRQSNAIKSPKVGISSCIIGKNTKYDGGNNLSEICAYLASKCLWIDFCPEVYGELGTPRVPCERVGKKVFNKNHEDKTEAFIKGCQRALKQLSLEPIDVIILKEGSPSCGVHRIYDGSFTHRKISGRGMLTEYLSALPIKIYSEELFTK